MYIEDIKIGIIDATNGWQGLNTTAVIDEDGNPVTGVKVVSGPGRYGG